MKTKSHRFFALGAVVVNLIAAPMVNSQTERFSASLAGANEVPPINSAGTAAFEIEQAVGIPACILGVVHGRVGLLHQGGEVPAVIGEDGHADGN